MFGCRWLPEAPSPVAARGLPLGAEPMLPPGASRWTPRALERLQGPGTSRSPKNWRIEISYWILQSRLSPERVGGASLVTDA